MKAKCISIQNIYNMEINKIVTTLLVTWFGFCMTEGAWFDEYSTFLTNPQGTAFESVSPTAIRSAGYFGGWYGLWYNDDQKASGYAPNMWRRVGNAGIRRMFYSDGGQIGDYAGFFDGSGKMIRNGWSLPSWNGSPEIVEARWFGLQAFMENVEWAPYPTADDYGFAPFTYPDGSTIEPGTLYDVLGKKSLNNSLSVIKSTSVKIDDQLALDSKLDQISEKINGQWKFREIKVIDYANPQMRDYRAFELVKLIEDHLPEGVHIDELGANNLWWPHQSSFGAWSVYLFNEYMSAKFTAAELAQMGIDDISVFDIRQYARRTRNSSDPLWTEDRIWNEFKIFKTVAGRDFWQVIADRIREKTEELNLDFAITGNLIPLWPGAGLNLGIADIADFEWMGEGHYPGFSEMGLPPKGRAAYVTRLGEKLSNAPYCWTNLYIEYAHANMEELHKVMAFDTFTNRGILGYSYDYNGKTHPGTDSSAQYINEVIDATVTHGLSSREYVADIGLVFNPWCDVAESLVNGMQYEESQEEYAGWCDYLVHTHRQWDVVHSEMVTPELLSQYPIIVLPSIVVLTDAQVTMLKDYTLAGGRLIRTGGTGKRHGPEGSLLSREVNSFEGFDAPEYRSTGAYPGTNYRLDNRNAGSAALMNFLLNFEDFTPSLEVDAPDTIGINLSRHGVEGRPVLSIDINNYDYDIDSDTVTEAPPAWITVALPPELQDRPLSIRYLYAGMEDYSMPIDMPEGRIIHEGNQVQIQALPTQYYQSILIDSPTDFWAGYPVGNLGHVNTDTWMGWINVSLNPWVWSYPLDGWMYLPESNVKTSGGWMYIIK